MSIEALHKKVEEDKDCDSIDRHHQHIRLIFFSFFFFFINNVHGKI